MNTKPVLLSTAVPVNLFSLPQSNKIELTLSVLLTDTPLARPSSIVLTERLAAGRGYVK